MSAAGPVSTVGVARERPLWVDCGGTDLFAVLTVPGAEASGPLAVLHPGGSWLTAHHRNRLFVTLARRLAEAGVPSIRFDYAGVGESGGPTRPRYRPDRPAGDDSRAIFRWARSEGFSRVAAVGSCFGARTALAVAPEVCGLEALVLLAPPLRDSRASDRVDAHSTFGTARRALDRRVLRGLADRQRRARYLEVARDVLGGRVGAAASPVSTGFRRSLAKVLDTGIPVYVAFGAKDAYLRDWERAVEGPLHRIAERAGNRLHVAVPDLHLHGFTSVAAQDWTVATVTDWLRHLPASG